MSEEGFVDEEKPSTKYRLAIGLAVRDVAAYLPRLLDVLFEVASASTDARIVIAENDSSDGTGELVANRAGSDPRVTFLQYSGLEELLPERTDRLAFVRNSIVDELVALTNGDDDWTLVVLDADEVTSGLQSGQVFELVDFLGEHPEYCGVAANSQPVYYDVWALRCDGWSPDDCWARVEQRSASVTYSEAVRVFVTERQRRVDSVDPPIPVSSAFGGLASYHLADVKLCRYAGRSRSGEVCCEHVPMHAELTALTGKSLVIVPSICLISPAEHLAEARVVAERSSGSPGFTNRPVGRFMKRGARVLKRAWYTFRR